MNKKRVLLGMSGGVDSSVAAYVLKEEGYEVIGVTMQIWPDLPGQVQEREGGCCSLSAVDDARRVANQLGIPFYVINFKEVFEEKVIDYFVDEYVRGRTPNPCIACNRYIKFDHFLKKALELDAFYIATGHYAAASYDSQRQRYLLKKSSAVGKDQTYALYSMTQHQLEHTLFPLGSYTKEQVRDIAKKIGLTVANKPDSQEICFVDDDDYGRFIEERLNKEIKPGNFVDTQGNVLGRHKGIIHYTIGQRKGLGIALGKPMYVVAIDPEKDLVVLGDHDQVFSKEMIVDEINFISVPSLREPTRVRVKIRYTAPEVPATLYPIKGNKIRVSFDKPERAITPGQAAVFYQDEYVLGGGTIETSLNY
ncbi:MAG: tRNA 2-thiouridine(34) synthase MnmA [Clostridiales bacterium]|nr:tRNA 2-thiouridine(34) synthase MnmA [Clostridiales bacterium]